VIVNELPAFTFGNSSIAVENAAAVRECFYEIFTQMLTVLVCVTILSTIMICVYSRVRREENERFLTTLLSVGAGRSQMNFIASAEVVAVSFMPILLSAVLAILPAKAVVNYIADFLGTEISYPSLLPLSIAITLLATLVLILFNLPSQISRNIALIGTIRRHNHSEVGNTHGYRRSFTFRSMPIEQRIAKKSVEYYSVPYRRITMMFVVSALFPILAIAFFFMLSDITITYTPMENGIDIEALVTELAGYIAVAVLLSFLVLSAFAILQVVNMVVMQNRIRNETLFVYRSVGMSEDGIKRVRAYEYKQVAFNAFIALIFVIVFLMFFLKLV